MPSSRDILAQLIAFDTVSRNPNLALIEYIRDYLADLGVDSELFFDDAGRKANLFATLGPRERGGVCLSGHTDVVPVDGQAWTVPPFALTEKDGRLYGRGSADMKGYIACVLAAVPAFLAQPLRLPLHLAFSYDEEVGCLGVRSLLAALEQRAHKPLVCIIGEPTELKPVLGHKGKLAMRCQVHGAACHSAYAPQGVNAIEYAAKLIGRLGEIGARLGVVDVGDRGVARFEATLGDAACLERRFARGLQRGDVVFGRKHGEVRLGNLEQQRLPREPQRGVARVGRIVHLPGVGVLCCAVEVLFDGHGPARTRGACCTRIERDAVARPEAAAGEVRAGGFLIDGSVAHVAGCEDLGQEARAALLAPRCVGLVLGHGGGIDRIVRERIVGSGEQVGLGMCH
jgi:hypothetical protein